MTIEFTSLAQTELFNIYDLEGRFVDGCYTDERVACMAAKVWANGNGEGCTVVSSLDETACLHDVTPDW